jgi:opacity protein-like surface antigen
MKKIILTLFAISSICQHGFGKKVNTDDIFDKYRFSIFAGYGINTLKPVNSTASNYAVTNQKSKGNFNFGISADWVLNDRYTAFSGIGIDWRGGTISAVHDTMNALAANYLRSTNVNYQLQYLTIPVGLKLKAAEFDKVKLFAQTGLDLAILLSQKGDYTGVLASGLPSTPIANSKLKGSASALPVNFGWSLGVGAEYKLNKNNSFYATILYRNGITDATTPQFNDNGKKFADGNIRSNTFGLRIGYYF